MIRKITLLMLALFCMTALNGQTKMQVLDKTYDVDTLFHAKVGPGTTQTSLVLSGPGNLRVFYLTIDLNDPTVSIRTGCGQDKLAGGETTAGFAKRKSAPGALYFSGVNGDFFATSGTASNGASIVGTPTSATIVDGEIYKTSGGNKQFAIDAKGLPFVGQADFTTGTIASGSDYVPFKAVNVGAPNNAVTIFTPRYYGVTNQPSQAGACAQVTAKLVAGETFTPGKTCKMEITSTATSTGDIAIPSDGYVIHGRGTSTSGGTKSAIDFVNGLKIGDVVTITPKITIDGVSVDAYQMISGNPRTVGDGKTLDTEGERGDASAYHPRTGIGYGDNKSKVIMMVVDGRSSISSGVRTSELADIMRFAGATDAINLDGGGSSTLYTSALGVRNHPSDGTDRADGNHIYAVTSAPEDNEISEIRFVDWAMKFPKYGVYTPQFYGYNKYGVLVNTDVKGVVLSCPPELGRIENLNTFVGDGNGTHAITATYQALTTSIPITIIQSEKVENRLSEIITDSYRSYEVEVQAEMNESMMPISPAALTWSAEDPSIVEINPNTGVLKGLKDGETNIYGTIGATTVTSKVKVQVPKSKYMPIDEELDMTTWKLTQTGGTGITGTPLENGVKLTYVGNGSSRGANIKLTKELVLWSLPDALRIRINPGDAPMTKLNISATPNGGSAINYISTETIIANQENVFEIPIETFCDKSDLVNFPIKINNITLTMGVSTNGKEYTIDMPGIETRYDSYTSSVEGVKISKDKLVIYPNPVNVGENINIMLEKDGVASINIFNGMGQLVNSSVVTAENGVATIAANNMVPGIYLVQIKQDNVSKTTSIIIR